MTERERNDCEWADLSNWTLPVGFYFSKQDSRWIVPKRTPMLGWTFNLGQTKGAWALLLSFLLPTLVVTGTMLVLVFAGGCRP